MKKLAQGFTQHQVGGAGFTLIEILVVISIIGILTMLVSANFNSARSRARDIQRKSDLSQYRSSLESYANTRNGLYPVYASATDMSATLCASLDMAKCPDDPKGSSYGIYRYESDASGTKYVLWSLLENATSGTYWAVCSGGKSGQATTGIPPAGGTCPL